MGDLGIVIRKYYIIPDETSPCPDLANILDSLGGYLCDEFESTRETSYLNRAIELAHEAIEATPLCSELWPIRLQVLGTRVFIKFEHTQTLANLEEAISVFQGIVDAISLDATDTALLGWLLSARFSMTGNVADLDRAINITRNAIDIILPNDPNHPALLSFLADQLMHRHDVTMEVTDIDEAICLGQNLISTVPPNHPERADFLSNLAGKFINRYFSTKNTADLDEAIHLAQEANEAISLNDQNLVKLQYGQYLWLRYDCSKETADLEEAIYMLLEIAEADQKDERVWSQALFSLASCSFSRYLCKFEKADINTTVIILRELIATAPIDNPERRRALSYFGQILYIQYQLTDADIDLDEAICVIREAINDTSLDYDSWLEKLIQLASFLTERYNNTGSRPDIEESIGLMRQILEVIAVDDPHRRDVLHVLTISLLNSHRLTGVLKDIDEAIQMSRDSLYANQSLGYYVSRPQTLSLLGACLEERYYCTGAMSDLEESILLQREAVASAPSYYNGRDELLSSLGISLGHKYDRTHALEDLNESISLFQEVLEISSISLQRRHDVCHSLASALSSRFFISGKRADLLESIAMSREAVSSVSKDRRTRGTMLSSLGLHLYMNYSFTGTKSHLDEAIRVGQDAVNVFLPGDPERATSLLGLGRYLASRSTHTKAVANFGTAALAMLLNDPLTANLKISEANANIEQHIPMLLRNGENFPDVGTALFDPEAEAEALSDMAYARQCFIDALHHEPAIVSVRCFAGLQTLVSPDFIHHPKAYDVAKYTTDLIPLLTFGSLQNSDKQSMLSRVVGTSSIAAAIALHTLPANRGPSAAIECLETGRGLIGGSLLQQYEVSTLRKLHPDLADSLFTLRGRLDMPAPQNSSPMANVATENIDINGNERHKAEQQSADLLEAIRSRPGFQRFFLPASELDMLHAASNGPIVILNMCSYRCDALIIELSGLRVVELPQLSQGFSSEKLIAMYSRDPESAETLAWLWDEIVRPVLDALGFTGPPIDDIWPHVWWIPTGALTKFPLHAAGHHLRRSGETTLDRVISSYATSVKAIIHSRRRGAPAAVEPLSLVAVAMEATEGHKPLIHANREVDAIFGIFESKTVNCQRPQPYKVDVLSAMKTCQIFHFAGHGETHLTDPLSSKLLLKDWQKDPLTVASLLETDLSSNPPFLAYLSACGTGQILDEDNLDESIHLVNAFQLAGFRHVIGTLWRVEDELCVEIAEMTYESLRGGMRDDLVSRGLHDAIRKLRDRWIDTAGGGIGSESRAADGFREGRHAQLDDDEELGRPLWIPYVHFGV
ncbi:hypothetical protein CFAM422_005757 [Trichoderma lentiforme]|uniref:CHAT domain-containing protein n=1 Tax=Trichoderma lentiforme TaxID=1567552 RepID=A0A9P4XG59_9HYPO|nr:hypothetical protein CFAM422_005757 [Trichoderma lentiforme]